MAKNKSIDEAAYANMLDYLYQLNNTDSAGYINDIEFISDNFWLQDTAVVENIELRKGEWNIYLVFAHHQLPLKFIKRKIKNYSCPKRAALAAHLMRKQAAKDQRGTLTVNPLLINLIFN